MAGRVHYQLTADEKRAVDALNKVIAKQDKVNQKFRETKRTSKSAGDAMGSITSKVTGLLSVGSAAAAIAAAFKEADTNAKAAQGRIAGIVPHLKGLLGMTDDLQSGELIAAKLRMAYGFTGPDAANFYNKTKAVGFTDKEILGDVGKLRMIEAKPLEVALAIQKLRLKYGKGIFGGTAASQAAALGVAGAASQSTASDVALLALAPMSVGSELGFKPGNMLAAVAMASRAAPTPAEGATQVSSLFAAMLKNRKQFQGLSLQDAVGSLAGMGDDERLAILGGRKEALLGLRLLAPNNQAIATLADEIRAQAAIGGTEQGFLARKARLAEEHPTLSATIALERATARKEIAESTAGVRETFEQATLERTRAALEQQRRAGMITTLGHWMSRRKLDLWDMWNTDDPDDMARGMKEIVEGTGFLSYLSGTPTMDPRYAQQADQLSRSLKPIIEKWEHAIELQQKLVDDALLLSNTINPDVRSEGY